MTENAEFGSIFGSVGHFISNAAKTAGKEIGKAGKTLQKAGGAIDYAIAKIPVVGAPMHTVMGAAYHAATAPAHLFVDIAIKGKRVDKAFLGQLKTAVKDVKDVAPYAQQVVSMVPGVGTGVAAAIAAGTAVAEGQPIDKILTSAVISAVPGGSMAKSAASAAAAGLSAAIHGQKFDVASAAGGLINGLPIDKKAKEALTNGIHMTSDIIKGKKVDAAVADALIKTGLASLPPDIKKAFHTGIAVQTGAVLQQARAAGLPEIHNKMIESGIQLSKTVPAIGEARKLAGKGTRGFDLAHGIASQKAKVFDIIHVRASLKDPADQKGFDMALASRIGLVAHPPHPKLSPAAQAGRALTHGMQGIPHIENKQAIMKSIEANPSALVGAKVALNQIVVQREPWPKRVVRIVRSVFIHPKAAPQLPAPVAAHR